MFLIVGITGALIVYGLQPIKPSMSWEIRLGLVA